MLVSDVHDAARLGWDYRSLWNAIGIRHCIAIGIQLRDARSPFREQLVEALRGLLLPVVRSDNRIHERPTVVAGCVALQQFVDQSA